ncbi:hypothetical protein QBA57_24735 [Streptomyces scabiei]|uniref:hypothetical protein n=1 Tax=Streptomyces scabiei TaxID=1930 RepID=UPI001B301CFE|nr:MULTISPECIES: hypothetical protein [Streptomyces]MBP5863347.1 hypothetical protein [Streptomyces sp. LBUM 1484]MBP5876150.1 hypothetical protein [Streptomyces sp. LBUM 1477]MBP5883886.1 hypothetical protein [Streptomyces sp. LBUM 1487]MBP5899902.1 hypothetical protein [Streptomyces sp. LBUM 1488]MDX2631103.1 hypothetical protein [Streptomyces scabiei]
MRARAWVLLLAAGFALLQFASVTGRATPDTKNYVAYALALGGAGPREAAAGAVDHYCGSRAATAGRKQGVDVVRFRAPSPAARVAEECRRKLWRKVDRGLAAGRTDGPIPPFASERFQRIFEVRPGYPVLLAPFVAVFGVVWGVWLASVLIAAAGGVLAFLVLRAVRAPTPVALTGQALFYVLPCGATAMRPMTEGVLLALTLAALWGCALAMEGRVRVGVSLVGGALAALFTVKHSQALFLGVCLVGACAVVAVRRSRGGEHGGARGGEHCEERGGERSEERAGRGPVEPWVRAVAAVSAGAAVCTPVLAGLLRYPASTESLQDLLTDHYTHPDRARLWPEFLRLESAFWVEWVRRQLIQPLFLAALAAGAWGAARQRPVFGWFVIAGACTGILNQAGHPDITIWGDRLIVVAWLLPVLGLPLLLERVTAPRGSLDVVTAS